MKKVYWLILMGLLLGCGGEAAPTAVRTQPPTVETEAEVIPTETAIPPEPTSTPIPPTATAVPATETATPAPPDVPTFVWLPYATGNYGQPVLMLEDGELVQQPMPVEVEIFFDYEAGWLAYGSEFWGATDNQQSVTNLHVYDFATETDEQWAEGNIGRAAISPASSGTEPLRAAVAVHQGQGFSLFIFSLPRSSFPLIDDIDPYFSWSPDGSQIAYLRDGDLFVTSSTIDSGNPPVASGVYQNSQWIGDAPLWLGDSGYLLYADVPFTIVATDGSETIVPVSGNDVSLDKGRPLTMLYSSTHNQLIAETEGMFGAGVVVYQLSEDFATAVISQQIADAQLAGWYEEGDSLTLVSGGLPMILPLTPPD